MSQEKEKALSGIELKDPQNVLTIIGLAAALVLTYFAYFYSGWSLVLLFWIGAGIGFTLFHARFGFSAVYREIVESGNTQMLRAHMLMLAIAATLFLPIFVFDLGWFNATPEGAVSALSVGLVVGSFIFGFGMEMGSGMAPSSLYKAEGGRSAMMCTLLGFLTGAVIGASHFGFWNDTLPAGPDISLAVDTGLGYVGAWLLSLFIFAAVAAGSYMYKKRKRPPVLPALPAAVGWRKIFFGSWPLWVGALLLAVLNAAALMVQGEPWKLTAAFILWGSQLVELTGVNVDQWQYWIAEDRLAALQQTIFMDGTSMLNLGVITGTFLTMTIGGLVRFERIPLRIIILALGGGLLMGYGASISFGANIGSYFSGIASFSLHAWVWTCFAVLGVYSAYFLEKKLQLTQSKKEK